ncbi:MAG: ParB/RepB/Spo0J family partition protein [Phycisphaerae bacterium]
MSKPAPRLGRGLSALIGPRTTTVLRSETSAPASTVAPASPLIPTIGETVSHSPAPGGVQMISIDQIQRNPYQPRTEFDQVALDELAASIRQSGILQPVLVRRAEGAFQLVAGERRWRAARLAGLQVVPAIVKSLSDSEAMELALVENLQREDLGPLERATAYQQYLNTFNVSADALAGKLGESRANVANYLRLLKLAPDVQTMLARQALSMGHARALLSINDPQKQLALAKLVQRRNLSVRQVEELAKSADAVAVASAEPAHNRPGDKHIDDVARSFSKAIGLRVSVVPGRGKNTGRVVLHYQSLEEFDRLAERIGGRASID